MTLLLSHKLAQTDISLMFYCPGCHELHTIRTGVGPGPRWAWDGNAEMPTFTPSILCTFTIGDRHAVCHSFVRAGRIQFLGDCTHDLAGRTVDLPDLPNYVLEAAS